MRSQQPTRSSLTTYATTSSPSRAIVYGFLTEGVAGLYVVCPKVNVADLLYVTRLRENRGYFNKIQQKHVDFVLCEPGPMRPVAVVELDDTSHQRRDRQERDELLDQVFQAAGLPIIHFAARSGYKCRGRFRRGEAGLDVNIRRNASNRPGSACYLR